MVAMPQRTSEPPTPTIMLCPACARPNPGDARYCYHDGIGLSGLQVDGPVNLAQTPFPMPFYFPTGDACRNFDQLALTCQARWAETWELLQKSMLEGFLAQMGRHDLARAAREAAAQLDPDRGVDHFLSRLPAHNLAPPALRVTPAQQQLGVLRPGQDLAFDVQLTNDGHRLVSGHVSSDCTWLQVEGATPEQPRVMQFAQQQTIRVHVVGSQLAAGPTLREGRLLVHSNGGDAVVAVSCEVPVKPFPDGALAGCRTPREVARQAKHFPDEAAVLFAAGQVEAWYRDNGWTYPVEGSPATGKAAVQQFFEALGLTKPPAVVLDTTSVVLQERRAGGCKRRFGCTPTTSGQSSRSAARRRHGCRSSRTR